MRGVTCCGRQAADAGAVQHVLGKQECRVSCGAGGVQEAELQRTAGRRTKEEGEPLRSLTHATLPRLQLLLLLLRLLGPMPQLLGQVQLVLLLLLLLLLLLQPRSLELPHRVGSCCLVLRVMVRGQASCSLLCRQDSCGLLSCLRVGLPALTTGEGCESGPAAQLLLLLLLLGCQPAARLGLMLPGVPLLAVLRGLEQLLSGRGGRTSEALLLLCCC